MSQLLEGMRDILSQTNQDDPCFCAQTSSTRPVRASPVLDHVLSDIREIYPAASRVDVSHEALSIAISLCPIVMTIIRVFLVRLSLFHPVAADCPLVVVVIGIFTFDCKQFLVLLQWAARAGICEKNRLIIIDIWFPKIRIWRRVNRLGKLLDSFVRIQRGTRQDETGTPRRTEPIV